MFSYTVLIGAFGLCAVAVVLPLAFSFAVDAVCGWFGRNR